MKPLSHVVAAWAVAALAIACPGRKPPEGSGPGPFDAQFPPGVCAECRDEKCHDLVDACEADSLDCECMSACLGSENVGRIPFCTEVCGLDEPPARFLDLEVCVAAACPDEEDECSTPDDYVAPDGTVLTTTADIGAGALADCGIDRALPFDPDGEVLQLESSDGSVCARIERVADPASAGDFTTWILRSVDVGPLGEVARIALDDDGASAVAPADASACFYSSHHNFQDWVHVWTGTQPGADELGNATLRYDLKLEHIGHDGPRNYALHVFAQGPVGSGECAALADGEDARGAPLRLFPVEP